MSARSIAMAALAIGCSLAAADPASRPANADERAAAGIDDAAVTVRVRTGARQADGERRNAPSGWPGGEYLTRIGTAFVGRTSAFRHAGAPPSLYCLSGATDPFATATLDLPDQARITYLDVFGLDNTATENMSVFLMSTCRGFGDTSTPTTTILGSTSTAGTPGDFVVTLDLSGAPVVVDRGVCRYFARVRLSSSISGPCVGGALFLDKVRVEYALP
ncbi:hypothetical protein [Dokdonella sp.]|uniref:hypothetical protein n=1 Tax=Dokdonella sp. TaxID=2291710 RepID=UPI0031C8BD7F|nr:hypothetical protein [Dokdonella sp.]